MKKNFLFLILILSQRLCLGQCGLSYCGPNLVPNSGLENCSNSLGCGNNEMHLNCSKAIGWIGVTTSTGPYNGSTPDYRGVNCNNGTTNTCGSAASTLGFFTYHSLAGSNTRESVQCYLQQALQAGKTYCVEFKTWAQSGTGTIGLPFGYSDGLGVYFSNHRINYDTLPGASANTFLGSFFTPQVKNTANNFITPTCQTISHTFVATGNEQWMLFSNFNTDAQTHYQSANPGFCYVYIDDVSVREVCANNALSVTAATASVCPGANATLTATPVGGTGPYTYLWSPGNSTNSSLTVPASTSSNYTVTVTDANNQSASAVVQVMVFPEITATINTTASNCGTSNGSASIQAGGGTPGYTYNWLPPANGTTGQVLQLGPGTYTCEITDSKNCSKKFEGIIDAIKGPEATLTKLINANCETGDLGLASFIVNHGSAPFTYSWQGTVPPSAIVNFTNLPATSYCQVSELNEGTYTLQINDQYNCKTNVSFEIKKTGEVRIHAPNVFSPNNDQVNDVFFIRGDCVEIKSVKIYNRWGQVITQWEGSKTGWDGTKEDNAPDGMYYVLFETQDRYGETRQHKGFVSLFR